MRFHAQEWFKDLSLLDSSLFYDLEGAQGLRSSKGAHSGIGK